MELKLPEVIVKVEDGMLNLTDLWKASGENPSSHPRFWMRTGDAANFMAALKNKLKVTTDHIYRTVMGRNGGVWAHWQLAMAYAQYLSPELHLQINDVYKRFKSGDAEIAVEVIERNKNKEDLTWIGARAFSKSANISLKEAIADVYGPGRGISNVNSRVCNANNVAITGHRATSLKKARGGILNKPSRDVMVVEELINMAFLENFESRAIRKLKVNGDRTVIYDKVKECIDMVKDIIDMHK